MMIFTQFQNMFPSLARAVKQYGPVQDARNKIYLETIYGVTLIFTYYDMSRWDLVTEEFKP